jgi:hypothetical protein
MKIAPHHIEGTPENKISNLLNTNTSYSPKCDWPEDCTVQWGNGLVPSTPFFEAFPTGTFIRGEGATIEEAEEKAFAKYIREFLCDHLWGRQRPNRDLYTNGAGWCRHCGAFRSNMFKEIIILGHWRKPLERWEDEWLASLDTDHELNDHMDRKYPNERERRKKSQRILTIRKKLFGALDSI